LVRLGIDSRDAFAEHPRGVGKALSELIHHLLPLVSDWEVNLYTIRAGNIEFAPARTKRVDIRGDRFNAWEQIRLPLAALTSRLDLLHCPSQTAPFTAPCPIVLTVHDLIPIRIVDGWSPTMVKRFARCLAQSVRKARRIIAISEFTKKELLSTFDIPENKIDVVRWGIDRKVGEIPSKEFWERLCQEYGIRLPFFVAFGGEAPRKNVPRILEALNFFVREVNRDVQLLLLGVPALARAKFAAIAERLGVSRNMIQIGYIADSTVAALLARSEGLVYASLYEGFGLPILEAMAAGSPVITSSVTSMPEIAGNAALLIDPYNPHSIKDAMRACYLNEPIKLGMRQKGLDRIKSFPWKRSAELTFATYKRALAGT